MTLDEWASRWGVPPEAIQEFRAQCYAEPVPSATGAEADATRAVRLAATEAGARLWRNNVGALRDDTGRFVRYGLCNESPSMNTQIKSADLVGIRPRVVTPLDVGHTIGQFVAREVKRPGWTYRGAGREPAQLRFLEIVRMFGGSAEFTTGAF